MSAVESWFVPAAVAEPLPPRSYGRASAALPSTLPARPRRPRAAPAAAKPKARKSQRRSFRVRGSLVWMAVFALLLVGVVAVNVAVLRANVSVTDLDKQIAQHEQAIATLKSQYARGTAAPRVAAAAGRSGLVRALSADTSLLNVLPGK